LRSPKYQEKFLSQELSLLHKVWSLSDCSQGHDLVVVDVGAGNGCLGLLAALVLNAKIVLIDLAPPPVEFRVEEKLPTPYRDRMHRIAGDVADEKVQEELWVLLASLGVRHAILVAKHLCGLGTDLAMALARQWREREACPELRGVVLATCCSHKMGAAERDTFAALHSGNSFPPVAEAELSSLLAICTRGCSWRTDAGASSISALRVRAAELFEDILQQPRLSLLRRLFPEVREVAFVPRANTPQNRCIVAGPSNWLDGDQDVAFLCALRTARDAILASVRGPLDLRPHGYASAKYDYDGTAGA